MRKPGEEFAKVEKKKSKKSKTSRKHIDSQQDHRMSVV